MEGAVLPSLGNSSEGNILGISKEAEAKLNPNIDRDDNDRLESTWKISSEDIKCKTKDGRPFVLGEGNYLSNHQFP